MAEKLAVSWGGLTVGTFSDEMGELVLKTSFENCFGVVLWRVGVGRRSRHRH